MDTSRTLAWPLHTKMWLLFVCLVTFLIPLRCEASLHPHSNSSPTAAVVDSFRLTAVMPNGVRLGLSELLSLGLNDLVFASGSVVDTKKLCFNLGIVMIAALSFATLVLGGRVVAIKIVFGGESKRTQRSAQARSGKAGDRSRRDRKTIDLRIVIRVLVFITLMTSLGFVRPANAQLPYRLDTVSSWGGAVSGLQKVGSIGYMGRGQNLVVLDMSNEANIQEIRAINFGATIQDCAVRGNYLYVITNAYPHLFTVLDISAPTSPQIVWDAVPSGGLGNAALCRIQFYANILYISEGNGGQGTYAFDVTNPASPGAINYITFGSGSTRTLENDMRIVGSYAYTIGRNPSDAFVYHLSIYNLAPDPLHPTTLVGTVRIPEAKLGIAHLDVQGGRAVIQTRIVDPETSSVQRQVIRTCDVSDPQNPVMRGGYDDFVKASGVVIQGNYAFVADWLDDTIKRSPLDPSYDRLKGLAILDISNLASPTLVTTYNTDHSSIYDVRVAGNRAYIFCCGQGLEVLDISNIGPQSPPVRIGGYFSPSTLREMTKSGNRLYAVDQFNGFTILDVSNPNVTPVVLGVYRGQGSYRYQGHWNVQIRKGMAYLAAGHGGIQVVDVSNPATPTFVYQYREQADVFNVHAVELDGDVMHAAYDRFPSNDGLTDKWHAYYANFQISPQPFTMLGRLDMTSPFVIERPSFHRLTTKQGISFCARLSSHGYRIDTRVLAQPVFLHPFEDSWGGSDYERVGNTLFAVDNQTPKFDILNIGDPVNPIVLGTVPSVQCYSVAAVGSRAYFGWAEPTGSSRGVAAMDCSNPAAPQVIATQYATGVSAVVDLVADENLVYGVLAHETFGNLTQLQGGIAIMSFSCYANCDGSTATPVLTANDFQCFLNKFASGDSYANCDGSTATPVLTANDFQCFLNLYAAGCNN